MVYRLRNVRVLGSQKRSGSLQLPEILSDCWDESAQDSYHREITVTVTELTETNLVIKKYNEKDRKFCKKIFFDHYFSTLGNHSEVSLL